MRLRLTLERGLILSTATVIISLQIVIWRSDRRPAAELAATVVQMQQQQKQAKKVGYTGKSRIDSAPDDDADDLSKTHAGDEGGDGGDENDANGDDEDAKAPDMVLFQLTLTLKRAVDYLVYNLLRLGMFSAQEEPKLNQTSRLLPNESSVSVARKQHLASECQRRGLSSKQWPRVPATMLVSDKFKVMYCMIGKVASSTWKKVFLMASGKIAANRADEFQHRSVGARALRVLQPMNSRHSARNGQRLNNYFKFLFVRHPLDRLLSAFLEKFRMVPEYMHGYGRRIIRRYRSNASAESLQSGNDVSLDEFVRFMVDKGLKFNKDVHWTSQYDLCQPCNIHYDFIGHYETLWSDGDFVMQHLGIKADVTFPRWIKNRTDSERFEKAYERVKPEYIERLKKLYARDYEFFGYS